MALPSVHTPSSFVLVLPGKVCLSLLGTWSGPGWDPKTSTLLQVCAAFPKRDEEPLPCHGLGVYGGGFARLVGGDSRSRNARRLSEW